MSEVSKANHRYPQAWATTILLAIFSFLSFLDRQILAVLVSDLRADLRITDIQFGWLAGPMFFIVYNLTLLPASLLVDRWSRKAMIAVGVTVWSALTIASAFAESYSALLVLRGGVAFGEALLGPAAISLIGSLFPREDRPLPTATYIAGSTIGSTGAVLIGALVLQSAQVIGALPLLGLDEPWRLTLLAVGALGLVLVALFIITAPEPGRDGTAMSSPTAEGNLQATKRDTAYFLLATVAFACVLMNMASVAIWAPAALSRSFGLPLVSAGIQLGLASLVGGVAGNLALAPLVRHLVTRGRMDATLSLVLIAMALASTAALIGGVATNRGSAIAGYGFFMFFAGGVSIMPTLLVQLYVPDAMRGRAAAIVFFTLYLFAFGLTPILVPSIASLLPPSPRATGISIGVIALVSGMLAMLLFLLCRKTLHAAERAAQRPPARARLGATELQGQP